MSVAENMGINEVWYGADYSDRENRFPDCYQEYVVKMNEMMAISGVRPIKLVAPLLGMSKDLIVKILDKQFTIQLADMHSGYDSPSCACCEEKPKRPEWPNGPERIEESDVSTVEKR